ncbi:MAG TPA: GNAT family N-acetyltransferase [Streptosporangiaceae bacterium]|nr:GNAT family N-acetyltransferase [Streptosporangiaceae bacterium]
MQITVVRPADLGPREIAAWHGLQRQSDALASPFLCPEFAIAVGHCNPSARVAVLADGGQLAGFFPFEQRRFGLGAPIGAGLNDSQGLIGAPGTDWDPRQLLRACGLSEWQFDHLVAGQQSFAPHVTVVSPSPVIDLAGGYGDYAGQLQARSPQFCRDTARKARKLERELGELRLEADSRDLAELRTLMAWKSDQYRRNGWVDVFDRLWVAELVERLFAARGATFQGLLSVLYAGDKPVAAHFGLRAGPVLAHWFPAYDAQFARHSPGLIQHLRMAEQTSALGVELIDMGTGTERYKQTLRSRDLMVAEGVVTSGPVAAGAHRLRTAGARWARQQARRHPPLFRAANRVLRHYGRVA